MLDMHSVSAALTHLDDVHDAGGQLLGGQQLTGQEVLPASQEVCRQSKQPTWQCLGTNFSAAVLPLASATASCVNAALMHCVLAHLHWLDDSVLQQAGRVGRPPVHQQLWNINTGEQYSWVRPLHDVVQHNTMTMHVRPSMSNTPSNHIPLPDKLCHQLAAAVAVE
jgi:hypothetical protein